MKQELYFLLGTILIAAGMSGSGAQSLASNSDTGKIILFRGGTLYAAAAACPIHYNGQEIVELGRNKYAEWSVTPGNYIIYNKFNNLTVSVSAGETKYIRCHIKSTAFSNKSQFRVVSQAVFDARSDELEPKKILAVP